MADSAPDQTDSPDETEWPTAAGREHRTLFTGRSGHLAVMAEFLHRGINVAIPEVDIGDDVFVVRGDDEAVTRVQVKAANGADQQNESYVAQFNLPWNQLDRPDRPALVYVLVVGHGERWSDFLVIRRAVLLQLQADYGIGTVVRNKQGEPGSLMLRLVFTRDDVWSSPETMYRPGDSVFNDSAAPLNRGPRLSFSQKNEGDVWVQPDERQ